MKRTLSKILSVVLAGSALTVSLMAQSYPQISEADMQELMKHAQTMQACMANVDQAQLQALEQRGLQMESEIKSMCTNGQRDAAQQKAKTFAMEIAQSPVLRDTEHCSELAATVTQLIPYADVSGYHVCD
tara:strand:+ start:1843 stop:2232 length:390 start_codon:yes stop_codon:yes gene_type:complete